jgi:hypothetical protein
MLYIYNNSIRSKKTMMSTQPTNTLQLVPSGVSMNILESSPAQMICIGDEYFAVQDAMARTTVSDPNIKIFSLVCKKVEMKHYQFVGQRNKQFEPANLHTLSTVIKMLKAKVTTIDGLTVIRYDVSRLFRAGKNWGVRVEFTDLPNDVHKFEIIGEPVQAIKPKAPKKPAALKAPKKQPEPQKRAAPHTYEQIQKKLDADDKENENRIKPPPKVEKTKTRFIYKFNKNGDIERQMERYVNSVVNCMESDLLYAFGAQSDGYKETILDHLQNYIDKHRGATRDPKEIPYDEQIINMVRNEPAVPYIVEEDEDTKAELIETEEEDENGDESSRTEVMENNSDSESDSEDDDDSKKSTQKPTPRDPDEDRDEYMMPRLPWE